MNKAQLEVIRLNNEDVIATSCRSAYGLMIVFPGDGNKHNYSGATNDYYEVDYVTIDGILYEGNYENFQNNFDKQDQDAEFGFYHFHINNSGKIKLDEKCECTDSSMFDKDHHNLRIIN